MSGREAEQHVGNLPGGENCAPSDEMVSNCVPPAENDNAFIAHGATTRDQRSWGVVLGRAEPGCPGRKGRVAAYVRTDAVADLGPVIAALAAACSPRNET
jgi:hypothetical protein